MREVAGFDFGRYLAVARWPLVELLVAYEERLRENAYRNYQHRVLVWSALGPNQKDKKAPQPPKILNDE